MLHSKNPLAAEGWFQENSLKHMITRTRLRPKEERASPLQTLVTAALDDMKAVNVRVLDVRALTDIVDTMVIASGNSDRHVRSIAERVVEKAKAAGCRPLGTEGAPRSAGGTAHNAIAAEGQRLLGAVRPGDHVAVLDERGTQLSTRELAAWLQERMQQGEDLAFLIGGPDGLAPQVLARGNFTLSLSGLTLPHALVRVLLAEQLYRAHSILTHHPYHRD